MKRMFLQVLLPVLIFSCTIDLWASSSDFSGIWITKSSKSQTIVRKSGNGYHFEKTGFHRGRRTSFKGYMTERSGRMILKYDAGVSATAVIKNPKLFIESSTVKWEKVSSSTSMPRFNLTGQWKDSCIMDIKQQGTMLSGSDCRGRSLKGQIYGYIFYLDVLSENSRKITYTYIVENNNRIYSPSLYSKTKYITRAGSTVKPSAEPVKKAAEKTRIESGQILKVQGRWKIKGYKGSVNITGSGKNIRAKAEYMYFFKKVRWEGEGTLAGDSVTLKYHYTKNRPGGRGDGIMHLKVKGNKMRGKWVEASKKRSGKISLERK